MMARRALPPEPSCTFPDTDDPASRNVVRVVFPLAVPAKGVAAICRQLAALAGASSPDEAVGERLIDAELAATPALARLPALGLGEVAGKLDTAERLIVDGEGWASPGCLAILRSTLADLSPMAAVSARMHG